MLNKSVYLPYAAGCIAAYSFAKQDIRNEYRLCDFIFMKSPIQDVISTLDNPFVIGFSCYMWNIDYNLSLAKAVKEKWKDCIIVLGGPQIPDDFDVLAQNPFADILIHGEGEHSFYELLKALADGEDLQNVHNISYRSAHGLSRTQTLLIPSLEDFVSPYAAGLFDRITENPAHKDLQFDAVLETTRGCPHKCIYCCWSGMEGKFRQFPTQRVKDDLKWMATHKVAFCICADSNFGILDRDEEVASYIIELKKEYGYPQKFETTATKNKSDLTFRINSKLESVGLNRGISLAIQSFSPDVLKIIGRQNLSFDAFSKELERYRNSGMFTYTDLILGLPGETLDSFCRGLFNIIEAGQHDSININRCELLPNTIMYRKEFVEQYKIRTISSRLCQNHSRINENDETGSRSDVVVETSTLPESDWRTALRISTCVQGFHCFGLLKFFAIYLRKAKNISYYDFYMNLYDWIEHKSVFVKNTLDTVCESIDRFLAKKGNLSFSDTRFGDIYWDFQEGLFLLCAADAERWRTEIRYFLSPYFDDQSLFEDLFNYQQECIALPNQTDKQLTCKYDWKEYFEKTFDKNFTHPVKKVCNYKIAAPNINDWENYSKEIVWYGKRSGKFINKISE